MGISLEKIEKWEKKKKAKKLIKALSNDRLEIRIRATKALSAVDDPEIINYLVQQLRDPEPQIRLTSVETLGEIGSERAMEFVRAMIEREEDEKVANAARTALTAIKEKIKQNKETA